jgi:hypothetical protein
MKNNKRFFVREVIYYSSSALFMSEFRKVSKIKTEKLNLPKDTWEIREGYGYNPTDKKTWYKHEKFISYEDGLSWFKENEQFEVQKDFDVEGYDSWIRSVNKILQVNINDYKPLKF